MTLGSVRCKGLLYVASLPSLEACISLKKLDLSLSGECGNLMQITNVDVQSCLGQCISLLELTLDLIYCEGLFEVAHCRAWRLASISRN